jgi:hypothetical protein
MPSPRLPRHLRLCHPPGTAHQVRRAQKTARVTFLTDGDDSPQRSHAKSDDGGSNTPRDVSDQTPGVATGKVSWWGTAMSSIASLGFKTTPTGVNAQTPDALAVSTPQETEEKEGTCGENVQDTSPGLVGKTTKSPARRLKDQQRAVARLQRLQTPDTPATSTLRETAEKEGTLGENVQETSQWLSRQRDKKAARGTRQIQRKSEDNAKKEGQSPFFLRRVATSGWSGRVRQLQSTSAEERGKPPEPREPPVVQRDDTPTVQQQLQQLFEQVRNLQATLEGRLAAEQPSTTPGRSTSTTKSDISGETERQSESEVLPSIHKVFTRKVYGPFGEPFRPIHKSVAPATTESQASHEAAVINSEKKPRAPRSSKTYAQTYTKARSAYRESIVQLGKTAEVLTDLPPRAVAPIASAILQQFRTLEQRETKLDREIIKIAKKCKHVLRSLADGLAQLSVTDYTPPDFISSGTPATHWIDRSLQTCRKGYQASTVALVNVANTLDGIRSPAVSPILTHVRNRLREIAEHAKLERDSDTASVLGQYSHWKLLYAEAKYSLTVIKQPVAVIRLEVVDIERRFNKVLKDISSLGKEISLITPSSPRRRINKKYAGQAELPAVNTWAPGAEVLRSDKIRSQTRVRAAETAKVTESKKQHIAEKRKDRQATEQVVSAARGTDSMDTYITDKKHDGQRLTRQIHTQSRSMKSSEHLNINTEDGDHETSKAKKSSESKTKTPSKLSSKATFPSATAANALSKSAPRNDELSEQSLLEELFPEATSIPQPRYSEKRDQYPKLELPDSTPIVRRELVDGARTSKEQLVDSFQSKGEQITVLQLTNCSTELTEADFQRLIPKGKHIEAWRRDGDFYKIIPGRDPLSLERMAFYYILFRDAEAALAYQKNASRLHKLSALHQPANIFSAIPPPKGFLEDGEDITAAVQSYNLLPTQHPLSLSVLMQPYNPALRALIERGGYQPIAPSTLSDGTRIWKVLLHIEGYEPTPSDLFKILSREAYKQGMTLPLRNESHSSIHRLRDIINLKTSVKPISSASPRAYSSFEHNNKTVNETTYADPAIQSMLAGAEEDNENALNQLVMNRVYNRWVLDFEDEDSARRWALSWHRRVLPDHGKGGWREGEEVRVCNTEVLW